MTTRYSYLSSANRLFLLGASIAICDAEAVNEAAAEGNLNMLKYLNAQGIDIYTRDALVHAAMYGHLEVVKLLSRMSKGTSKLGCLEFALTVAAKGNHLAVVDLIRGKCEQITYIPFIFAVGLDSPHIPPLGVAEYLLDTCENQIPPIRSKITLACVEEHRAGKERFKELLISNWKSGVMTLVANYL